MVTRFEKLFALPPNLYSEGSPIIVSAGSLLKDIETEKIVVQLKFKNISSELIKALKIDISAYDVSGKSVEGINNYQYLDLAIGNGEEFGANKAIILPNTVTRSFSIKNISVVFLNGLTIDVSLPLCELPKPKTLNSELKNGELVRQYQIKTNEKAAYIPLTLGELWCCSCGSWMSCSVCTSCKLENKKAFESLDISMLELEMEKRLKFEQEEKIHNQELEQKRMEQAQVLKKRSNKMMLLICIFLVALLSLAIYHSQHKYDEISGIYALSDLDEAESSIYNLSGDLIDEYGFNPYSYEIKIEGSGKIYGLWFVNDRGSLSPRAATIKSVSDDGICKIDVKDNPNAIVTFSVSIETDEASYHSENRYKSLDLSYRRISKELAKNGYQPYSKDEIIDDIEFVVDLFNLKKSDEVLEKYPSATAEGAKDDIKIDGSFCGADGSFEIWEIESGIYRIIFEQGIYDMNSEKENLINALNSVFGKYTYSKRFEIYTWESEDYNIKIDYHVHEGIYFFRY